MADAIKIFAPDSPEYKKLKLAADFLTEFSSGNKTYTVKDTYFDFRQKWKWTTIIAAKPNGMSYQFLNPKEQETILYGNADDFIEYLRNATAR